MTDLRDKLIRLAYSRPDIRSRVLPLLKESTHGPHRIARIIVGSYEQNADYFARNAVEVITGKFCRITFGNGGLLVEELPQKGKKRLQYAVMKWGGLINIYRELNHFIPSNLKQDIGFSKGDTFKALERKIENAIVDIAMSIEQEYDYLDAEKVYNNVSFSTDEVWYLKVRPADSEPIEAAGKDFIVKSGYNAFSAKFSRGGDPYEPSYTMVKSTSSRSARKLYKMLNNDPDLLSRVPFDDFTDWLDKNKIKYKLHFSQWR